ncbi:MAG: hypothetical protein H3C31_11375 [Brumimicrobium sp.]|nr:hypothetical protein [Brumimicrobium sp.]
MNEFLKKPLIMNIGIGFVLFIVLYLLFRFFTDVRIFQDYAFLFSLVLTVIFIVGRYITLKLYQDGTISELNPDNPFFTEEEIKEMETKKLFDKDDELIREIDEAALEDDDDY